MNEILKSLGNAKDKARKHTYRCLCPGCQNKSINSHLVQQHPYLESIAEEGLLYQIIDEETHPLTAGFNDYKEVLRSTPRTLSMPLFCSHHDNELFKSIESGSLDLKSVNTFLLFSFRALASQRYLEEKRNILYQNTGFDGKPFKFQTAYSSHIIARFDSTLKLLYDDIFSGHLEEYVFKVATLPYIPVCGSDVAVDDDEMSYSYCNGNRTIRPLDGLYMTLLPSVTKDFLHAILGYHSKHVSEGQMIFFNRVLDESTNKTAYELLYRMKNWCAAPSLFKNSGFAEDYSCRRVEIVLGQGGC